MSPKMKMYFRNLVSKKALAPEIHDDDDDDDDDEDSEDDDEDDDDDDEDDEDDDDDDSCLSSPSWRRKVSAARPRRPRPRPVSKRCP